MTTKTSNKMLSAILSVACAGALVVGGVPMAMAPAQAAENEGIAVQADTVEYTISYYLDGNLFHVEKIAAEEIDFGNDSRDYDKALEVAGKWAYPNGYIVPSVSSLPTNKDGREFNARLQQAFLDNVDIIRVIKNGDQEETKTFTGALSQPVCDTDKTDDETQYAYLLDEYEDIPEGYEVASRDISVRRYVWAPGAAGWDMGVYSVTLTYEVAPIPMTAWTIKATGLGDKAPADKTVEVREGSIPKPDQDYVIDEAPVGYKFVTVNVNDLTHVIEVEYAEDRTQAEPWTIHIKYLNSDWSVEKTETEYTDPVWLGDNSAPDYTAPDKDGYYTHLFNTVASERAFYVEYLAMGDMTWNVKIEGAPGIKDYTFDLREDKKPVEGIDFIAPAAPIGYKYVGSRTETVYPDGVMQNNVILTYTEDHSQTYQWTVKTVFAGGEKDGVTESKTTPQWVLDETVPTVGMAAVDGYLTPVKTVDAATHIITITYDALSNVTWTIKFDGVDDPEDKTFEMREDKAPVEGTDFKTPFVRGYKIVEGPVIDDAAHTVTYKFEKVYCDYTISHLDADGNKIAEDTKMSMWLADPAHNNGLLHLDEYDLSQHKVEIPGYEFDRAHQSLGAEYKVAIYYKEKNATWTIVTDGVDGDIEKTFELREDKTPIEGQDFEAPETPEGFEFVEGPVIDPDNHTITYKFDKIDEPAQPEEPKDEPADEPEQPADEPSDEPRPADEPKQETKPLTPLPNVSGDDDDLPKTGDTAPIGVAIAALAALAGAGIYRRGRK